MTAPMFLPSATSFHAFRGCALVRRRADIRLIETLTTSIKATQPPPSTPTPSLAKSLPLVPIPTQKLALPPLPYAPSPRSAPLVSLTSLTSSVPSSSSPEKKVGEAKAKKLKTPIIQEVIKGLYHADKQASMDFSRLVSDIYQRLKTEGYITKKNEALTVQAVSIATKQLIVSSNIPGIPEADRKVMHSTVPMSHKEAAKAAKLGLIPIEAIAGGVPKQTVSMDKKAGSKAVEKSIPGQLSSKEPKDKNSDNGRTVDGKNLKDEKTSKDGTQKSKAVDEMTKDAKIDKISTNEAKPAEKLRATKMDKVEDYSLGPRSQELYATTVRKVLWLSCYDFLRKHQDVIDDKVRARMVERCLQSCPRTSAQDWASFDLRAMLIIFSEFSDSFIIKKDGKNKSLLIGHHKPSEPARLFLTMRRLINLDSHDNHLDPRGRYPDREMDALIGTASNCLAMLGMDDKLLKSLLYEFKAIKILGKPPIEKVPFTFEPDFVREAILNEVHTSSAAASEAHDTPITTEELTTTEGPATIEMTFNYIDSLTDLAEMAPAASSLKPSSPNLTVQEWAELKTAMMCSKEVMRMATEIYNAAKKQTDPKQKIRWFVRNARILLRASEEMPTLVSYKSSGLQKLNG